MLDKRCQFVTASLANEFVCEYCDFIDVDIAGKFVDAMFNLQEIECTIKDLSLIHISEPTRRTPISYAVFCLKKIFF